MQDKEKKEQCYKKYIEDQREGYEIIAKMVGYVIEKMAESGLIDEDVHISGRLKSFKSAYENDLKKVPDDCFGIRIVAKDEKDVKSIISEISKILIVLETRQHGTDGKEKYDGTHQIVDMHKGYAERSKTANNAIFPIVEIQYWTKELEEKCVNGELAYSRYKRKNIPRILEMYRKDPEMVYSKLPTYYEIKGNTARVLEKQETLFKIYPEIEAALKDKGENEEDYDVC